MDEHDSIEELRKQLVAERQARGEAQRRAEEAERQRQQERQRGDEAERLRRKTTLTEYIEACHTHLFKNFAVQADKSLTSKGSLTSPADKWCPTSLLGWPDFLERQKTISGKLHSVFPYDVRAFENLIFLQGLGDRVSRRKVANERDLEYIQHTILEEPVSTIVEQIGTRDADNEFGLRGGVVFENHPNVLSDVAEEPRSRRDGPDFNQLRADQICVYKSGTGAAHRTLSFIVEYKAPHKLTLPQIRLGLRDMNIYEDVVNRPTKPTAEDETALFQYYADRLTAAAVTQTYHYMIEGGLEYSYLTTGEAIVFLKIDWHDPTVLYYHLAEPLAEVEAHPDNFLYCTAVSQVVAFTLLAVDSPQHGQDERRMAMTMLNTWATDPETILRAIPVSDRKRSPPASAFRSKTYSTFDRSPYPSRTRAAREICHPKTPPGRGLSPEGSDDESADQLPETPILSRLRTRREVRRPQDDGRQGSSSENTQKRQYCTQRCLLGLLGGCLLDYGCPNYSLHIRGGDGGRYHAVDHATWLRLLREQLARTLDDGITPSGEQGARGAMFRVSLVGYGYTFVAKGTVPEFVDDLRHEAAVYRLLRPLQGVCAPVFLGEVDLGWPYYYDHRVRVVHMMFLSWGGEPLGQVPRDLGRELDRSVRILRRMGVTHNDVREANALWCEETQRVMVIDFERATVAKRPLDRIAHNKRHNTKLWKSAMPMAPALRRARFAPRGRFPFGPSTKTAIP